MCISKSSTQPLYVIERRVVGAGKCDVIPVAYSQYRASETGPKSQQASGHDHEMHVYSESVARSAVEYPSRMSSSLYTLNSRGKIPSRILDGRVSNDGGNSFSM